MRSFAWACLMAAHVCCTNAPPPSDTTTLTAAPIAEPPSSSPPDVFDHRNYAVLHEQIPPVGYQDIHGKSTWPGSFQHAVHYHRGYRAGLDDAVGCYDTAVAPDGTLCPSVVLPGDRLTTVAAERLIALHQRPRKGPLRVIMCPPDPEHSVVFYDAMGTPIAELAFSLTRCPGWKAAPGEHRAFQDGIERRAVAALCDSRGWGYCHPNQGPGPPEEAGDFFGLHGASARRLRTTPPATAPATPLSAATQGQRRELCVWNSTHVVSSRPPGRRVGYARIDEPDIHYVGRTLDWVECVEHFPRCERTVGELLDCMEIAQRGDPWFLHDDNRQCRPLRACIWGFEALILDSAEAARYLDG